ncbi:MFS transporter [Motilimonas pumila]|uniref:MFS transporter n=1 Tax=Motilimonas pumila TaxID=2303987 RepID=A0A418YB17_9GAMM|nr:MFS transporter [Motilimonas pumila]RJG40176.1 MFS transporter [Motilimonas pumila]
MNKNVYLLTLCQALLMSGNIVLISVVGLIGQQLAPNSSLITLPVAMQFVGLMAATMPASFIMSKVGRKRGFMLGNVIGILGAGLVVWALSVEHFWLFCLAASLLGVGIGFGSLYRFAALEVAAPEQRSQAMSFSMAGGVLAAIVGPNLAVHSQTWFGGELYSGAFLVVMLLNVLALVLLTLVKLPPYTQHHEQGAQPLLAVIRSPGYATAVFTAVVAYAVMNLLMTVTPLAMLHCGFAFPQAAGVIKWHVLGMFAPAFFTGHLIQRFGCKCMIFAGAALFIACIGVNWHGTSLWHFRVALTLLGVGWNFMFIAATQALTQTYQEQNKAKAQGFNEFMVFASVAFTSLLSGWLDAQVGWQQLNLWVLPVIIAVVLVMLIPSQRKDNHRQV